jgi:hypothetical protein
LSSARRRAAAGAATWRKRTGNTGGRPAGGGPAGKIQVRPRAARVTIRLSPGTEVEPTTRRRARRDGRTKEIPSDA